MRGVLRSLAVVVAGSGLVLGVAYLPAPLSLARGTSHGPAMTPLVEPVTQAQVICPGPEALGIAGLKDSLAQVVSVTAATAPESALPTGLAVGHNPGTLTMSGLPTGGTWADPVTVRGQTTSTTISTAQSALVAGAGALAPGTVATQRSWVKSGDNRALVTAACMPAAASSWLIGGGGDPGRRERLILTNPGPNPVTVDLTVLGVKGPIQSPNGHGLVVGPHARTVILLDAIAGSEPSPVVHIVVQGGEVAAVLSDTWLDGVIPRGGDDTTPVAAPALEQVMAGVAIDGRATLRIAVPGDGEAVVEARVLTTSGPKPLDAIGVTRLAAHSTTDINLSALPPGAYAVQVRADVPVVAAAMVERRPPALGAPSDLAWSGASAPITTLAGMALDGKALVGKAVVGKAVVGKAVVGKAVVGKAVVGKAVVGKAVTAPGGTGLMGRLDLAATYHPASVLVTTVGADGQASTKEVAIGADSVSSVALDGATSVWVTPLTGVVRAAVLTWATDAVGTLLSVTPLSDLTLTTTSVVLRELRN